jgi:ABC-type multidrug transport system fused ATPase/permease subunit
VTRTDPSSDLSLRQLVAPYVRAERRRLLIVSVCAVVGGFCEAGILVIIARVAFALASSKDTISIDVGPVSATLSTGVVIGVAAALAVARTALQIVQVRVSSRAITSVVRESQRQLVSNFLAADWPLQSVQRGGRLQQLVGSYGPASATAIGACAAGAIAAFNLGALLLTAVAVSAVASIAAAGAALLIGFVLRPMRAGVRRRASRTAAAGLEMTTGVTELTGTLMETRTFGVEREAGAPVIELINVAADRSLQQAYLSGLILVAYQGIAMLLIVGVLGIVYAAGFTGIGSISAVVLIMLRSLSYGQAAQNSIQTLHESAPMLDVLREEIAAYRDAAVPHGGEPVRRVASMAFDHVSFEYVTGRPVLRNVSFELHPGEVVGIIGPSGSGKSTLVQILLRLRVPTEGAFLVNGRDARELDIDDWYSRIAFVPQDAHLFAGTIADNIRFFRDIVDAGAIEHAAKLANLHDEIVSWPDGYDTPVGERGGQLSGGQRQRLCIARALVGDPDVLVLDEPTSSLDVKSEALVRQTLDELGHDTTVLVVAHRLSTLSICDRIMVVRDGVLQGFAEPARLEAEDSFYQEALQLSGLR